LTIEIPFIAAFVGLTITAKFDGGRLSSDGGAIVLREIADRLGLADAITEPVADQRDPARVRHTHAETATARISAEQYLKY
jgi:hypothetical protein